MRHRQPRRSAIVAAATLLVLGTWAVSPVRAGATIQVDVQGAALGGAGCSLPEAILAANQDSSMVRFDPGPRHPRGRSSTPGAPQDLVTTSSNWSRVCIPTAQPFSDPISESAPPRFRSSTRPSRSKVVARSSSEARRPPMTSGSSRSARTATSTCARSRSRASAPKAAAARTVVAAAWARVARSSSTTARCASSGARSRAIPRPVATATTSRRPTVAVVAAAASAGGGGFGSHGGGGGGGARGDGGDGARAQRRWWRWHAPGRRLSGPDRTETSAATCAAAQGTTSTTSGGADGFDAAVPAAAAGVVRTASS